MVRHQDWKLQVNNRPTDGLHYWLFNLESYPTEQNNLAYVNKDKRDQLLNLLAKHQANSVEPLYRPTLQVPVMIDKTSAESFVETDEYIYIYQTNIMDFFTKNWKY